MSFPTVMIAGHP